MERKKQEYEMLQFVALVERYLEVLLEGEIKRQWQVLKDSGEITDEWEVVRDVSFFFLSSILLSLLQVPATELLVEWQKILQETEIELEGDTEAKQAWIVLRRVSPFVSFRLLSLLCS